MNAPDRVSEALWLPRGPKCTARLRQCHKCNGDAPGHDLCGSNARQYKLKRRRDREVIRIFFFLLFEMLVCLSYMLTVYETPIL